MGKPSLTLIVTHGDGRRGVIGLFTIKSFYQSLLVREETHFPHLSIWIPRAPRKVFFFCMVGSKGNDSDS